MLFKIYKNNYYSPLKDFIQARYNINTRNIYNYHVSHIRTNTCKMGFWYFGPKLWNILPQNTKACYTISTFKNNLKRNIIWSYTLSYCFYPSCFFDGFYLFILTEVSFYFWLSCYLFLSIFFYLFMPLGRTDIVSDSGFILLFLSHCLNSVMLYHVLSLLLFIFCKNV